MNTVKKRNWFLRLFFNRYILILILCFVIYSLYKANRPVIYSVPSTHAGNEIHVLGKKFGNSMGFSYVQLKLKSGEIKDLKENVKWNSEELVLSPVTFKGDFEIRIVKKFLFIPWYSDWHYYMAMPRNLPSKPYGYDTPVQENSPWPLFRHDRKNTGCSPLRARYNNDLPWVFRTGKGIFSTPVIDRNGNIYVGSADHYFYALKPDGKQIWRFKTDEIIDSGAAIPEESDSTKETILVPSGDGHLYCLKLKDSLSPKRRIKWKFSGESVSNTHYNNWFEGNVTLGFDGTIYAGNTNFNYFAINKDGTLKWNYVTASNNWSIAAIDDDGTIYWGSNDTYIRAVNPAGKELWKHMTLGFIAASAAIGNGSNLYIGSFDSYMYALNRFTGKTTWKFKARDHIYASAAILSSADKKHESILFGSTDGIFYSVSDEGKLQWTFEAGSPIRSSAAIGLAPDGEKGHIVYFGCGNGKLYALNAETGELRWEYNTSSEEYELIDRNDLNSSPALGKTGIYIGGEHGFVCYVPYDFPLHNPAGKFIKKEIVRKDSAYWLYVSPGGNYTEKSVPEISAGGILTLQLKVYKGGKSVEAWMCNSPWGCPDVPVEVKTEPAFSYKLDKSADGQYLFIRPTGFLKPGTTYSIRLSGNYYTNGTNIGNLTFGGDVTGSFNQEIQVKTAASQAKSPLYANANEVAAFEWTRLSTPIPTMMPSLNQIGFDYMDWIMGVVNISNNPQKGKYIIWTIGAKYDDYGLLVPDSKSPFVFPLNGEFSGDLFYMKIQGLNMPITGIPIKFNQLEMRGTMNPDYRVGIGASIFADTKVLDIPTFGKYLVLAGLANDIYKKLLVAGTFVTRPLAPGHYVNRRPDSVMVTNIKYTPPQKKTAGELSVELSSAIKSKLDAGKHVAGILLVDAKQEQAMFLDYKALTQTVTARDNTISKVVLTIPPKTLIPEGCEAYIILDVFPVQKLKIRELKQ